MFAFQVTRKSTEKVFMYKNISYKVLSGSYMPLSVQYCIRGTIMFALGGDFAEGNMVISAFIDNQHSFTTKDIFFVTLIFQVKWTFNSSRFQAGAFKANYIENYGTPLLPKSNPFLLFT